MDIVSALASLVRVTETGSFSAVARERDISKAAVARQISFLEQHFGVRLLHRTTRKLSLTDDGQMLLGFARPVLEGIETMEATLGKQSASPVGLVRVGIMVAASHFLAPRLPALLATHLGLKVELVVSDTFGDMIEDRLDLAMRVGEIADASVIARRIGIAARVVVAAPGYIERHGQPSNPAELAHHTCIVHDVGPDSDVWTFAGPQSARKTSGSPVASSQMTAARCIWLPVPAMASPFFRSFRWSTTSAKASSFASWATIPRQDCHSASSIPRDDTWRRARAWSWSLL